MIQNGVLSELHNHETHVLFEDDHPKLPEFLEHLYDSTRKYENLRVDWHQVAPTKDDRKLRTNKKKPNIRVSFQSEQSQLEQFPSKTNTEPLCLSQTLPPKKNKQKRHESSRIKLLVVITSVVKPLPELLPGDRVEVCELRLGGVCLKGRLEPPPKKWEKTGSRTYQL